MNKDTAIEIQRAEALTEIIIRLMINDYKAKGFTSLEIANNLGIHKSGMSRIKNGLYQLDLSRFLSICGMTGQNPIELIKRAETVYASTHKKHV